MDIKRICSHLLTTEGKVKRAFPRDTLAVIERAIKVSETQHDGEICVAIEGALHSTALFNGQSARERAIKVFSDLRIWDTERNNGVLIYLLLADRDVEIVADRGIHATAGAQVWETICRTMETAFSHGDYEKGLTGGIEAVAQHLSAHFPPRGARANELPDRPILL